MYEHPPQKSDLSEEKTIFWEHIKKAGLKRTAQRDVILEVFLRTEGHSSAEDLYQVVKEEDPTVGFTTVYRTQLQPPASRPFDLYAVQRTDRVL
jgi:Fur family transcriptional regulator, ferric uptake regulator